MKTTLIELSLYLKEAWGFDFFDYGVEDNIIDRENSCGSVADKEGDIVIEFKILDSSADIMDMEIELIGYNNLEEID